MTAAAPSTSTRVASAPAQPGPASRRAVAITRRNPGGVVAACLLLFAALVALFGPYAPLPDPETPDLVARLQPPLSRGADGTLHLAGTDQLGRDVLARTVAGARISLGIALSAALLAGTIGTALGLLSGYRGGFIDLAVMRLVDLQMAFPSLLLAIFLLYLLGASLTNLVILLVIFSWAGFARVARAETLRLRNAPFIEGAIAVGAGTPRILLRHILPHILPVAAVVAVLDFASVMVAEASLSFLGLGVQPPGSSWGLMLAQSREFLYAGAWWLFAVPGGSLFIVTLCANLASRWLQELLAPGA